MDVSGSFRHITRHCERYFVTFTYDLSRYGYVHLIKHNYDTFKLFKKFQREVENQLGKKIKIIHYDSGGEYHSDEFYNHH